MPEISLFIAAAALLTVAPGPDIIYVLTRGIAQGRRAGIAAALGFATGCIFHTVLAAVGIAALIRSSPVAFDVVRYAGAAYLVWIGVQALINMGVNMGLLPTKGLTLPLMSFGGSSLLANCVALAILLRIDWENRQLARGLHA